MHGVVVRGFPLIIFFYSQGDSRPRVRLSVVPWAARGDEQLNKIKSPWFSFTFCYFSCFLHLCRFDRGG